MDSEPAGRFSWSGAALTFKPVESLKANQQYKMCVSTSAEDNNGNSLADDFYFSFRTGPEGIRPAVLSVSPADGAVTDNPFEPVSVVFDVPVEFDSFLSRFSLTPEIIGSYGVNDVSDTFTFTPAGPWLWQNEYRIEIEDGLVSSAGYEMRSSFSSVFFTGTDSTAPEILGMESGDGSVSLFTSCGGGSDLPVNCGWEKDRPIRIRFSEEIEPDSALSAVTVSPAAQFETSIDHSRSPADLLVSFSANLERHRLYRLSVSTVIEDLQGNHLDEETACCIFIDGSSSAPPQISRVRMAPDGAAGFCVFDAENPAAAAGSHPILDTSAGEAQHEPFFIDYYISLAEGAELPPQQLLENFVIETENSCISLHYLNFQLFNPGDSVLPAAAPVPEPAASEAVLRRITSLSDTSTYSGMVTFQILRGLTDSLGNIMAENWMAELFDEDN